MRAAKQAEAPALAEWLRKPQRRVSAAVARSIQQDFPFWRAGAGPSRDEVHDTAYRGHSVQGRCHALDDFDLCEIHRRDLEDAGRARLPAIEREPVGENLRVPAAQTLD